MTTNLLVVQSPDRSLPWKYYVNGRRVSRDRFYEAEFGMRKSCLQTVHKNGKFYHYSVASNETLPPNPSPGEVLGFGGNARAA